MNCLRSILLEPFETRVIAGTKADYEREFNQLSQKSNIYDIADRSRSESVFSATITDAGVEDQTVYIKTDLIPETKWEFEKPVAWDETNDFVRFANKFGITDVSEINGEEVYVSFDKSSNGLSEDKTGEVCLLHSWDSIWTEETSDSLFDKSISLLRVIKSGLTG